METHKSYDMRLKDTALRKPFSTTAQQHDAALECIKKLQKAKVKMRQSSEKLKQSSRTFLFNIHTNKAFCVFEKKTIKFTKEPFNS